MKLHSLNQLPIDVTDACGRRAQESIAKQREDFESTLADNAKFKYNGFREDTNDFGGTPKTASGAEFTRLNSATASAFSWDTFCTASRKCPQKSE